ncbi:MAG TPA: MHYT domain-containing protein, partial [Thermoanaerobaculia bacterium]|nr:MHYT domain-containing protein [Thermoanaerobaculia bacterium]
MEPPHVLQCSYGRPALVLLSYAISVLGSYTALQCAEQVSHARGRRRVPWLAAAAVSMGGGGVWSMHFIAMSACVLPVAVAYDPTLTLASLLLAIAVTGIGLSLFALDPAKVARLLAGGSLAGIGIAGMHYTGMAAMRLPARITYRPMMVLASILIGVAAAILALWVAFNLRDALKRFGGAFVMAGAVCGMHYAGMAAARFVPYNQSLAAGLPVLRSDELAFTVFWVTLLVLALVLMESRVTDARRSEEALRKSYQDLQALSARLRSVREEESTRIARAVHDEVGQALTALRWDLDWLQQRLGASPPQAAVGEIAQRLRSMTQVLHSATDVAHRIATELRPATLDMLGLEAAIDWYVEALAERTGICFRVHSDLAGAVLDRERSTALYRILQEALTNAARHSEATEVDLRLHGEPTRVVLEVADNGKGIPLEAIEDSRALGLLGMRERARALGGDIQLRLNPT